MNKEIAIIFWKDSAIHGSEQRTLSEIKKLGLVNGISCGIIVDEDKEKITLAMDCFPKSQEKEGMVYEEDNFRVTSSYPKSGIKQIIKKLIK